MKLQIFSLLRKVTREAFGRRESLLHLLESEHIMEIIYMEKKKEVSAPL